MGNKNEIKMSLGTIICIFIIIFLILALAIVYYYGFIKTNSTILSDKSIQSKEKNNEYIDNKEKDTNLNNRKQYI